MEKGKKYVAMVKDPYLIDKERLRDPTIWFSKAAAYSATVLYLQENIILLKTGSKISHIFKAIETAPYLTGLAAELYMKGYLIFKGLEPDDVREFQHHLSDLRNKCLEYGDLRFKNDALIFFTDTLGEHIMKVGE